MRDASFLVRWRSSKKKKTSHNDQVWTHVWGGTIRFLTLLLLVGSLHRAGKGVVEMKCIFASAQSGSKCCLIINLSALFLKKILVLRLETKTSLQRGFTVAVTDHSTMWSFILMGSKIFHGSTKAPAHDRCNCTIVRPFFQTVSLEDQFTIYESRRIAS